MKIQPRTNALTKTAPPDRPDIDRAGEPRLEGLIHPRASQLLVWSAGIVVLGEALVDPRLRDASGFPTDTFCLFISIGVALICLGFTVAGRLRTFGLWFALALVGQAVALQLIEAGTLVRWQHYRPLGQMLTKTNPLLLIFLVAQTAFVVVGLRTRLPGIRAWITSSFTTWQIVVVSLVFVLASSAAQRVIPLYVGDLFVASFIQAVNLGNVVLLAWTFPTETLDTAWRILERLLGRDANGEARSGRVSWFVVGSAIWVTALAAALCVLSYERHPHITDEVAYVLQARFLADGAITLPAPPVADAFYIYMMETTGDRWYSAMPPGWPAILAVGVRLGAPWLVNPVLGGLNVLLTFFVLRELYDRRTARMAVLLLCISPWYIFMAMNLMNHTSTLTAMLVAAAAVVQGRRTGRAWWGVIAGMAVGLVGLIRPLDGVIVGALIGLWVIGVGGGRLRIPAIVAFAAGVLVLGGVMLAYNQSLTGSPTVFPVNAYFDRHYGPGRNDLGFGPNRGFGWPIQPLPGHSPLNATINANLNTFSINVELLGWSIGSLLLAAFLIVAGKLRRSDWLMIAVCLANFVPYFFYYFSGGPDFGARYWFLMLVPLIALTVRGIRLLQSKLVSGTGDSSRNETRVLVAVLALCFLTLVNYIPWRAIDKYHHYWGMRPDIATIAQEKGFGRSLVLIRATESHPDFASAAVYNPLAWDADAPIYAWDRSPGVEAALLEAFPDRPVWIVDGPSITHEGYRIVAGPLSAQYLRARGETATGDPP